MLFDDNFGFPNIDIFPPKISNSSLVSKEIGLARGNSYEDEYVPYKNYNPGALKGTSEKERKLIEILELCFRKIDLNLCLDLDPNNNELLDEFSNCVSQLATKESEYVKMYGPLEVMDSVNTDTFTWVSDPWPWENGGNKNV